MNIKLSSRRFLICLSSPNVLGKPYKIDKIINGLCTSHTFIDLVFVYEHNTIQNIRLICSGSCPLLEL